MKNLLGLTAVTALYAALSLGSGAAPAFAGNASTVPSAVDIMFERPHLSGLKAGTTLDYVLERKVSEPKLQGEGYTDTVTLNVTADGEDDRKSVRVDVFTGERKRDPREIAGMSGNPVLVFFLDRAVFNYAALAGGKRAYLKNRFRIELRDSAKVTPVKISYDGATVDGYKVSVSPYAIDPNKDKMRGYEKSTFDFYLSDQIPGHFAKFAMDISSQGEATPDLSETTTLKGAEVRE